MSVQDRFRVEKSAGIIYLHGSLRDETKVNILDEHISSGSEIMVDFSGLSGSSWLGMVAIDNYFKERKKKVRIIRIGYEIYRNLRLMTCFTETYLPEKIILPVIRATQDKDNQDIRIDYEEVEYQSFINDEMNRISSPFLCFNEEDKIYLGLSSEYYGKGGDAGIDWSSVPVFSEDQHLSDDFSFWFRFLSFCRLSLSHCLDAIQFTNISFHASLHEAYILAGEYSKASEAMGFTDPETAAISASIPDKVNFLSESLKEWISKLKDKISRTDQEIAKHLLNLKSCSAEDHSYDLLIADYSESFSELDNLKGLPEELEKIGEKFGATAQESDISKKIMRFIQKIIKIPDKNKKQLEMIRELFGIMNVLSEDSWEDTYDDLQESVDLIHRLTANAIQAIQGFDLVRQILEHRISEIKKSLEYFRAKNQNRGFDGAIKEEILRLMVLRAVTDQEKYAGMFYFPELKVRFRDRPASPGGILFFPSKTHPSE